MCIRDRVFAVEAQNLGRRASYPEARQKLNNQRRDRGYHGHGLKAKFTGQGRCTTKARRDQE
eukprot:8199678-Prorocentrum_lima.AAC.1